MLQEQTKELGKSGLALGAVNLCPHPAHGSQERVELAAPVPVGSGTDFLLSDSRGGFAHA